MASPSAVFSPSASRPAVRWALRLFAPAALLLCSLGCQTVEYRPEPFTTDQIVQSTRQNVPADEIIRRIRESRTVYHLRAREVKEILDQGVDERVVDEMMETPIREAAYNAWKYSYPYYYPYYYPYAGFGYYYRFH